MIYRRERPVCRKQLLWLIQHFDCATLEELLEKPVYFTPNMRQQALKMMTEGEFVTALELHRDARRDIINRSVGLIR